MDIQSVIGYRAIAKCELFSLILSLFISLSPMDTYGCGRVTNVMENRHHHHHRRPDAKLPDYVQTVVVKDSKGLEKILLLPKALDLDRPKRSRTAFAKWQLDTLETTFCSHPYLVGEQRTLLARRLGLSETQIKVWYQNRRTKQRKEGHPSGSEEHSPQTINSRREISSGDETNQLHHQSSSSRDHSAPESSGSPPETLTKWPQHQQLQQQHQAMSAEFFGQAFQHYHPAMYHQLIQSYSTHHHAIVSSGGNNVTGSVTNAGNLSNSSASAGVSSSDRGHHQIHRVY